MSPLNPESFNLTLEQQFMLRTVRNGVESASVENLKEFVIQLTMQNMVKDNIIRDGLKSNFTASYIP